MLGTILILFVLFIIAMVAIKILAVIFPLVVVLVLACIGYEGLTEYLNSTDYHFWVWVIMLVSFFIGAAHLDCLEPTDPE